MKYDLLELFILICIIVDILLAILIFFSNRKSIARQFGENQIEDKFLLEHVINTKVSIRIITSIGIIFFSLLSFFGYKELQSIEQGVTKAVVDRINEASHGSLEKLERSVDTVNTAKDKAIAYLRTMEGAARQGLEKRDSIAILVREALQSIKLLSGEMPSFIYVVDSISVSKSKHKYYFNELKPAGRLIFPKFEKAPLVYLIQHNDMMMFGGSPIKEVTNTYIDFEESEEPDKPYVLNFLVVSR